MHLQKIPLSAHQRSLPGILGGLGPLAHIEFEKRLLEQSLKRGACQDQDHPVWLLVNASATPDRTKSLHGQAPDAAPWLLNYSRQLQQMGANFLVVTCNTAHAFYSSVQPELDIPWIHMMQAVAKSIECKHPQVHKIGVMATAGTLRAHLYDASLRRVGLEAIAPNLNSAIQADIMSSIYDPIWGIKSSGATVSSVALKTLSTAVDWFSQQGADMVIAGCTELSVGLSRLDNLSLPWVDPLEIMADLTVGIALGEIVLKRAEEQPSSKAQHPSFTTLFST